MLKSSKLALAAILIFAICLIPATSFAHWGYHIKKDYRHHGNWSFGYDSDWDIEVRVEDQEVIVNFRDELHDQLLITEDDRLIIDNTEVDVTPEQQALLKEFRMTAIELDAGVRDIVKEGARIGLAGAKVGLKAVSSVFKLIFPDYDSDDLERDVNREADKLEKRAKLLEDRADRVEDLAHDIEDLADDLADKIPELSWLR